MDLNTLAVQDSAKIEIRHPETDDVIFDEAKTPKAMSVTVLAKHTKKYKQIQRRFGFDAVKKKNKSVEKMSFSEYDEAVAKNEAMNIEMLAKITTDCNLFIDGQYVKCDEKSLLEVYNNPIFSWLPVQIIEDMDEIGLFFKS